MIYLLDTNIISDWITDVPAVIEQTGKYLQQQHIVGLCPPIQYEIERGLRWKALDQKEKILREVIRPRLTYFRITDADWQQARHFWIHARTHGRQLSDIDLLLAALAYRLNAIIASSDTDFDVLPVKRENWRDPV